MAHNHHRYAYTERSKLVQMTIHICGSTTTPYPESLSLYHLRQPLHPRHSLLASRSYRIQWPYLPPPNRSNHQASAISDFSRSQPREASLRCVRSDEDVHGEVVAARRKDTSGSDRIPRDSIHRVRVSSQYLDRLTRVTLPDIYVTIYSI